MWDRLQLLVVSAKDLAGGRCCTTKRRRVEKRVYTDFIFGQREPPSVAECVLAIGSSVGAMAIATNPTSAATAACIAILVPVNNSLAGVPVSDAVKRSISHFQLINGAQLSFGLVEFLSGDIVNGFVHMMMAGAGFYVTKIDGIALLPSFSVACTLFAGVSTLNLVESVISGGTISANLPLTANFIKLGTIAHPVLYVLAAIYAWKLIEQLRAGLLDETNLSTSIVEPQPQSRPPFAGRGFRLNSAATLEQN
jgi:hypothetical protein